MGCVFDVFKKSAHGDGEVRWGMKILWYIRHFEMGRALDYAAAWFDMSKDEME